MKIFVTDNAYHYAKIIKDSVITKNIDEAELVIFTGGADVDPKLYGEEVGRFTGISEYRDNEEILIFKKAQELRIPCLGICRGSQFLTVLSGGKLIQHVNNHAIFGTHKIDTLEGELDITSTHHQMMYPYNLSMDDYALIGWTPEELATGYLNGDNKDHDFTQLNSDDNPEPEIVKYHKTNCLCIQGHPEMLLNNEDFMIKIRFIISKYLTNEAEENKGK
jgi:gamma-glutamyl-gamma-aminobutyrate hydrolase PuuD